MYSNFAFGGSAGPLASSVASCSRLAAGSVGVVGRDEPAADAGGMPAKLVPGTVGGGEPWR
jgi:hypothetical protein